MRTQAPGNRAINGQGGSVKRLSCAGVLVPLLVVGATVVIAVQALRSHHMYADAVHEAIHTENHSITWD